MIRLQHIYCSVTTSPQSLCPPRRQVDSVCNETILILLSIAVDVLVRISNVEEIVFFMMFLYGEKKCFTNGNLVMR